jgi:hypothetical protein
MSKNNSYLNDYIESQNTNKAANKLNFYRQMILKEDGVNPIGTLVRTLILKKLQKKANQEEKENRNKKAMMFEKYHRDRFNEAKYLEMIKAGLDEKKHQQELDKEERHHAYDLDKQEKKGAAKQRERIVSLIAKSYTNPLEGAAYEENPEEMEKKREEYDTNGWIKKNLGKSIEKLWGKEYKGKMASRTKK